MNKFSIFRVSKHGITYYYFIIEPYTFCEINFSKIIIINIYFPSKCNVVKNIDKILNMVLNKYCVLYYHFNLKMKALKIHVYSKIFNIM